MEQLWKDVKTLYKRIDRKKIRAKKHYRIRKNIHGTAECPRLAVYRSAKHIYAQLDIHSHQDLIDLVEKG